MLAYRNTPHSTTREPTSQLFFGRRLRTRPDLLKPDLSIQISNRQIDPSIANGAFEAFEFCFSVRRWTQHFTEIDQEKRKIEQICIWNPHDYRIYYVNIDFRHQYGISLSRRRSSSRNVLQRRGARRNGCLCRLLTFEPHSFPDFSQSQLWFYFLELLPAKLSFHMPSNHSLHSIVSCGVKLSPRKLLLVSSRTLVLNKADFATIWLPRRMRISFEVHLKWYLGFLTYLQCQW